jgi:hypothetical protein
VYGVLKPHVLSLTFKFKGYKLNAYINIINFQTTTPHRFVKVCEARSIRFYQKILQRLPYQLGEFVLHADIQLRKVSPFPPSWEQAELQTLGPAGWKARLI